MIGVNNALFEKNSSALTATAMCHLQLSVITLV